MKHAKGSQFAVKAGLIACLDATVECFRSLWREEDGQDLVEYSLLMGAIAVGSMAALHGAGNSVKTLWQSVSNDLSNAVTAAS